MVLEKVNGLTYNANIAKWQEVSPTWKGVEGAGDSMEHHQHQEDIEGKDSEGNSVEPTRDDNRAMSWANGFDEGVSALDIIGDNDNNHRGEEEGVWEGSLAAGKKVCALLHALLPSYAFDLLCNWDGTQISSVPNLHPEGVEEEQGKEESPGPGN
ncbi:hypothetical protein HD554DRAFT_2034911 [Boletus coccyginus]|nr:hypothetical protein HD554DRAFT_2034911 [Boletus coccyginus]